MHPVASRVRHGLLPLVVWLAVGQSVSYSQAPPPIEESKDEPIKYVGQEQTDARYHHGAVRGVVGVHRFQAFRANREHPPEIGSRAGWTYNHQPYLAYWNDRFYLQYLSDLKAEHLPPGRTLIMTSGDGRHWTSPNVVFPEYSLPEITIEDPRSGQMVRLAEGTPSVMHQRMGFFMSSQNRLLTLAFYSYCPTPHFGPNNGQGLGRVVREVFEDGTYGPIYFIRYNRHAGWNESNTRYPFYKESPDEGFVEACEELLADKLATLQWWEEDRAKDGFYTISPGDLEPKALSYYRRPDGVVVGIWKAQISALSPDEGETWTDFARAQTLKVCNAKVWGQRTEDGRYALVYNHSATRRNRFPMVVITGDDGHEFDEMLCLEEQVPPMRYYGWAKNHGSQYIRGIAEGNGDPPGNHLWTTYSVNKEDIWVSRARVPISGVVQDHVNQDFDGVRSISDLKLWDFYVPLWAPIEVVDLVGRDNRVLELKDEEPYDYALAKRAFPPTGKGTVEFRVFLREMGKDILEFELHDENNARALRLRFDPGHFGLTFDIGDTEETPMAIQPNAWYDLKLAFDCEAGEYDAWVNGEKVRDGLDLDIDSTSLERMVFRTGSWRSDVRQYLLEGEPDAPGLESEDVAAAGEKVPQSVFWIDDVKTTGE